MSEQTQKKQPQIAPMPTEEEVRQWQAEWSREENENRVEGRVLFPRKTIHSNPHD